MKREHETSSWEEYRKLISPARAAKNEAAAREKLRLMDLRKKLGVTQVELAKASGMAQGALSKLEHQPDAKLSTLRAYVEGLDAELQLFAKVGDELIPIVLWATTPKTKRAGKSPRSRRAA